jgi:UDP-N-acetylmuramate dehydrogenase
MIAETSLERLDALAVERGIALEHDVPVGPLTTLRVGGTADRLAVARSVTELRDVLELARESRTPTFILGKGSDVVVADAGIRGLVVRNRADAADDVDGSRTRWRIASGAPMAKLVKDFTRLELTGIEFGISIPGTLGGAVWANAGAHGGEMRDIVRRVEVLDTATGTWRWLDAADCAFSYRESRFKHSAEVILSAEIDLAAGERATIEAAVASHQSDRQATQPLADQNAGSVFRNPPGDFAGRLIDEAGLKGFRIGSAQVSELHANFIVVDRGGRAADVRAVGDHVRTVVAEGHGIELAYEIEFVGDWTSIAGASR